MKENQEKIEANKAAWASISDDHFEHFREKLSQMDFRLNPIVEKELGDITGKKILHLQCNTGADSILLARKGAVVTGVDLVPENVSNARKLAEHFGIEQISFIESDVLKLPEVHEGQYDIVLTTDGVLGWLPDLDTWGKVVSLFLKPEGYFYLHESHPFVMIFDENELTEGRLVPKYPYFQKESDLEEYIGGYGSEVKEAENYFWGHQLSTIIKGLISGGLYITYMEEYNRCAPGMGGKTDDGEGLYYYPELEDKLPLTFSLKARKMVSVEEKR